jgi:hypothetical protein
LVSVVLGVVVLVVIGGIVAFGVIRNDGPSAVVDDYFDGKRRHDCSYIELLSVERTKATNPEACEKDPEAYFRDVVAPEGACADFELELGDEQIDGDNATVDYEVVTDTAGCSDAGTVYLVREDGEWKVDHL